MRYIDRKKDTRKLLKRSIEVGPYEFKKIPATATTDPTTLMRRRSNSLRRVRAYRVGIRRNLRLRQYRNRLKETLEDSTKRQRSESLAAPPRPIFFIYTNSFRCDENPISTLGDYSKPSHEGYRNTIELPNGNNVVPLRSDTIQLVQNRCLFHERTRLHLFQFSLRDQASNWLKRLLAGPISRLEDLTTRFLAEFFPPRRTAKLCNDHLMFQQHQRESLSEAWTHFKDLL
ncbi:zinc finger, CCHC-type containing protein [Tanacetum coccineum]